MPRENRNENNEHVYGKSKDEQKEQSSPFSKNLLNSVYRDNGEVEVYGKILPAEEGRIEQISIVSNEMINYDKAFFYGVKKLPDGLDRKNYHPYFCELVIDEKISEEQQEKLKLFVGRWCKIKLAFGKAINKSAPKGHLIFCASPIERKFCSFVHSYVLSYSKKLKGILDKEIEDFERYIDQRNKRGKTFHQYNILPDIKNIEEISGRVYNVGQGNFISLKINSKYELLFDVGESRLPKDELNENDFIRKNEAEIVVLKPQYIIISHWDIDHILGVYKFSDREEFSFYKDSRWIAPDIAMIGKKASMSAKRLCAYLFKKNNITLINNPNGCFSSVEDANGGFIKLWQGDCQANPGTKANNIGLILEARICIDENSKLKYQNLLFAGDCSYFHMNSAILDKKYDFIVSSHHGAKSAVMKNLDYNEPNLWKRLFDVMCSSKSPNAQKDAKAIICTGYNNYRHPNWWHVYELQNKKFDVLYTAVCRYISFSVSKESKIKVNKCFCDKGMETFYKYEYLKNTFRH